MTAIVAVNLITKPFRSATGSKFCQESKTEDTEQVATQQI